MNKTLAIIKPDGISKKYSGDIIKSIEFNGFKILRMSKMTLKESQAKEFYAIHKDRSFFGELVNYMISGEVIVMALQKDNAVNEWRDLMGATDPLKANIGTIRKMYGASIGENVTHGSDSDDNANIEIKFFFPELV